MRKTNDYMTPAGGVGAVMGVTGATVLAWEDTMPQIREGTTLVVPHGCERGHDFSRAVWRHLNNWGALAPEATMKPPRHPAGIRSGTFLLTTSTYGRKRHFQVDVHAELLMRVLYESRALGRMLLHAFAVMPDHLHLLVTVPPEVGIEKLMQYIKGGYSFRAARELEYRQEIWQRGFDDQWITCEEAFVEAKHYVLHNPVKAGLAVTPQEFHFCSSFPGWEVDAAPDFAAAKAASVL